MELIAGTTLRPWLAKPRAWREVVDAFVSAGRGLAAAHAAGIVHRDFKPDNVLIDTDGRIVVTDFGLARAADEPEATKRTSEPALVDVTQTGAFVGTPAYMSPEQLRGDRADARSDQFSFCVALWEALYGERPFGGATFAEVRRSVLEDELPPPRGRQAKGPPAYVHAALTRGLAREPAMRFSSMAALLAALTPKRRARTWALVGFLALAATWGVFWTTRRDHAAVPESDPCIAIAKQIDDTWSETTRAMWHKRQGVAAAVDTFTLFDGMPFRGNLVRRAPTVHVCEISRSCSPESRSAASLWRPAATSM